MSAAVPRANPERTTESDRIEVGAQQAPVGIVAFDCSLAALKLSRSESRVG